MQEDNPDMAPFAKQLLTTKYWYHGRDYESAEKILNDLIVDVLGKNEDTTLSELEEDANTKLNVTW